MAKRKTTRSPSSSPDDPVTTYAVEVRDGIRIAGPHVRNQCKRHLLDIEDGAARGLVWDKARAVLAIEFFETVLKLNGGEYEGLPFKLLPWQKFIVGSLFGWMGADGFRRFRSAYVETAKGSGKSPLAAGIGMTGLVADGESRAEVYSAATKKDQAMILFRDAVAMVDHSPELTTRLQKSGTGERCWNLAYMATGSFFRPISSDDGQSGPRPHMALIDEIHEHKTNTVVEMMRAGTKSRRQALIFMITNSGSSRHGPCWGYHEYGAQVADGTRIDDSFFPYICALDFERKEPVSVDKAVRYMGRSCTCNVQTTQIDQLRQEDFVRVVSQSSISNGISSREGAVQTTQIGQLLLEACATAAMKHGCELTAQHLKHSPTLEQKDGRTPTKSVSVPIRSNGLKSKARITTTEEKLPDSERNSEYLNLTTQQFLNIRKEDAEFAEGQRGLSISRSITAIAQAMSEDCFVRSAIVESACSEIVSRIYAAHSHTCKIRQHSLSNGKLVLDLPADDPFESEECWPKANPSLQDANLPGFKYIREQVTEAKGMPSKEAIVRRLNFCQWTDAESPWISHEVWKGAFLEFDIEELRGRRAVAGLDLSSTTDLTGLTFLVAPVEEGEPWKIIPFAWLPDADLQRKSETDRVPYVQWAAEGYLNTTPGRAINKRLVLQKLSAMCEFFDVIAVAYDRWRIEDLLVIAEDEGISLPEMKPFGQGYKDMSPALENFERMLLNGEIAHNGHPILTMCAGNAVTDSDPAGNRKLDKQQATGRIDLILAAVMAAGLINMKTEGTSFWESGHEETTT